MTRRRQTTHADLNHLLNRAFPIMEGDLEANRAGKVSTKQREHMKANRQSLSLIFTGCGMVFLFMIILFVLALGAGAGNGGAGGLGTLLFVGLFVLIPLWLDVEKATADLETDTVLSIQGPVKRDIMNDYGKQRRSVLRVGRETFNVPWHVYSVIVDGESYVLYYLKDSRKLISAEHIASEAYPDIVIPPSAPAPVVEEPEPIIETIPLTTPEKLQRAFSTIDADLKENHEGYFSMSQQIRLYKKQLEAFMLVVAYVSIIAFFGFLFVCTTMIDPSVTLESHVVSFIILAVGLGLLVVSQPLFNATRDMRSNRVLAIEGPVERGSIVAKGRSGLWISFPEKEFRIWTNEIYEAFAEPGVYILYYTPRTETLMAAEYVPDTEDPDSSAEEDPIETMGVDDARG